MKDGKVSNILFILMSLLSFFNFGISGINNNDEHLSNIPFILLTLSKFHFVMSAILIMKNN